LFFQSMSMERFSISLCLPQSDSLFKESLEICFCDEIFPFKN